MKKLSFTKMHGTGNDFVVLDGTRRPVRVTPTLAKNLCDRHYGVGADQVLVLGSSRKADFRMGIYNADGSEVEMCGNGIRCAARFAHERGLTKKTEFTIETKGGIKIPRLDKGVVRVDMGEPILSAAQVPVRVRNSTTDRNSGSAATAALPPQVPGALRRATPGVRSSATDRWIDQPFRIPGVKTVFQSTAVSMGNPHFVFFVEDVDAVPLTVWGPAVETHGFFPKRTNVEFVQVTGPRAARVRVWERGAGVTLACGTGACAVGVAGVLTGRLQRRVELTLPGGVLGIEWAADNHVFLTGPAAFVFDGVWED